jgi:glyoxylase-like metal-dependent hydrolase (beta-lactamase superfamily II)/rhodanese-related sulfurtransferase
MEILSFRTPGLGDQSYLLVHGGSGILVDPQRDIDRFLDAAGERDVELRFVLETHLHNDYHSGAEQAAKVSGAELVLPAAAAPAYRHTAAFHGEPLDGGGGLVVRPIHTPGHTPEHTSYLVLIDGEPVAVFSGGSLLVGSAGRPDLLGPERAHTLAVLQHGSVHRLADLPRGVGLYPTHGAGSFCVVSGGNRTTSTVGAEADTNPLLALPDAEAFAAELMAHPMPIPAFYRYQGPANTLGVPPMPPLEVPELAETALASLPEGTQVIDIRPRDRQAAGFVPGSMGIELADDFGSWAGWLTSRGADIVLIADRDSDVAEAITQLAQIGVDTVVGVVYDPSPQLASRRFELAGIHRFLALTGHPDAQVLDVRMPHEREATPLDGALHEVGARFLPDLLTEGIPPWLDPGRPVLVACGSGRRASIAATLLAERGYRPVVLTGAGVPEVLAAHRDKAA